MVGYLFIMPLAPNYSMRAEQMPVFPPVYGCSENAIPFAPGSR